MKAQTSETTGDGKQQAQERSKRGLAVGDRILQSADTHADYAAAFGEWGRCRFVGASAIGQLHVQNGRCREDAFAIRTSDAWLAVAVADGVGTRPHSRYGAAYAVEALCEQLLRVAQDPTLIPCPASTADATAEPSASTSMPSPSVSTPFSGSSTSPDSEASPFAARPDQPEDLRDDTPERGTGEPVVVTPAETALARAGEPLRPGIVQAFLHWLSRLLRRAPEASEMAEPPRGEMPDGSLNLRGNESGEREVPPSIPVAPLATSAAGIAPGLAAHGVPTLSRELPPASSFPMPEQAVITQAEPVPEQASAVLPVVDGAPEAPAFPDLAAWTESPAEGSGVAATSYGTVAWQSAAAVHGGEAQGGRAACEPLTEERVRHAFQRARSGLEQYAEIRGLPIAELSCTLLGLLLNVETGEAAAGHIGDGLVATLRPSSGAEAFVSPLAPEGTGNVYSITRRDWEDFLAVRLMSADESASLSAFFLMTDGVSDNCTHPPPEDILTRWAQDVQGTLTRERNLPTAASGMLRWLAHFKVQGSYDDRTLVVVLNDVSP